MTNILKDFSDATTALVETAARRVVAVNGREWGSDEYRVVAAQTFDKYRENYRLTR